MRDLAKSAISLTWAMSLFGVKQMTNLLVPGKCSSAAESFAPITSAAVDTFGSTLKTVFQAGDVVQRGSIDTMVSFLSGQGLDFSSFLSPEARQQAAEAARQEAEAAKSGTTDQGWGPVPPVA